MEIFTYACIGALTGLFAGLLGIGGGSLFVPLYIIAFRFLACHMRSSSIWRLPHLWRR